MPTLNIQGRRVKVDDSFMALSPDQQNAVVEEIAQSFAEKAPAHKLERKTEEIGDYGAYTPVRTALQGSTFGFGDEIQAGIAAATAYPFVKDKGFKDLYKEARDELRGEQKAFSAENPKTALALEAAGGLATGGVGAGKFAAMKTLPRAAAYGAGTGALGGLGYSDSDSVAGDAINTIEGAAMGAVLAPALKLGSDKIITPLLNKGKGVAGKVANQLKSELSRSNLSPEKAAEQLRKNPSLLLGDLSENLQYRTASVAGLPGKGQEMAKKVLTERNRAQTERLLPHIRKGLGNKQGYLDAVDTLQTSMREKARPLYEQAYKTPLAPTKKISSALKKAQEMGAIKSAQKLARFEDLDYSDMPTIQQLDYVKRSLGDVEGKFLRAGKNQMARAVGNTRRQITEELKKQSPAYDKALKTWSSGMDDQNALDVGLKALKDNNESLVRQVKKMSESELNHFRIGVMKALENRLEGQAVTRDAVKQLQDIPRIQKALSIAFKDEDTYQGFLSALKDESKMFDTFTKALSNSNTARLAGSNQELGQGALNALISKGTSLPMDMGRSLLRRMGSQPEIKNEAFRNLLSEQLLKNDPAGLLSLLSQKQKTIPPALLGALGSQGGLLTRDL